MSHFAKIENDLVVQVIVAEQDFVDSLDGEWVQTSYNTRNNQHLLGGTPLRGNYAGVGYVYNRTNDVFYPQQPFPSWTLNSTTWSWEPPVEKPEGEDLNGLMQIYTWDEDAQNWVSTEGDG